jgi:hypothetical protein
MVPEVCYSDRFLDRWRSLEAHGLAGLDLDRFAGPRVDALLRLGFADGEGAEVGQSELAVLFQFLDDRLDQISRGTGGGNPGDLSGPLNHGGNKCL